MATNLTSLNAFQLRAVRAAIADARRARRLSRIPRLSADERSGWIEVSKLHMQTARNIRGISTVLPQQIDRFPLLHSGKNPSNYTAEVKRTGDSGIYDEVRISVFHPERGCVADVFVGLTEEGEPRVLLTASGKGNGDHQIAVYPLNQKDVAVDTNYN